MWDLNLGHLLENLECFVERREVELRRVGHVVYNVVISVIYIGIYMERGKGDINVGLIWVLSM